MHLGKYMQKGRQSNLPPSYFPRNNLSLVGCSPAEPTSVLIEQGKIQSKLLYLQSVKKSDHLHDIFAFLTFFFISLTKINIYEYEKTSLQTSDYKAKIEFY